MEPERDEDVIMTEHARVEEGEGLVSRLARASFVRVVRRVAKAFSQLEAAVICHDGAGEG